MVKKCPDWVPVKFLRCPNNISDRINRMLDSGREKSAKNRLFWVVFVKIRGVNVSETILNIYTSWTVIRSKFRQNFMNIAL